MSDKLSQNVEVNVNVNTEAAEKQIENLERRIDQLVDSAGKVQKLSRSYPESTIRAVKDPDRFIRKDAESAARKASAQQRSLIGEIEKAVGAGATGLKTAVGRFGGMTEMFTEKVRDVAQSTSDAALTASTLVELIDDFNNETSKALSVIKNLRAQEIESQTVKNKEGDTLSVNYRSATQRKAAARAAELQGLAELDIEDARQLFAKDLNQTGKELADMIGMDFKNVRDDMFQYIFSGDLFDEKGYLLGVDIEPKSLDIAQKMSEGLKLSLIDAMSSTMDAFVKEGNVFSDGSLWTQDQIDQVVATQIKVVNDQLIMSPAMLQAAMQHVISQAPSGVKWESVASASSKGHWDPYAPSSGIKAPGISPEQLARIAEYNRKDENGVSRASAALKKLEYEFQTPNPQTGKMEFNPKLAAAALEIEASSIMGKIFKAVMEARLDAYRDSIKNLSNLGADIGGIEDSEIMANLTRYADEAALAVIDEMERGFRLQPGTFLRSVGTTSALGFSGDVTKFQEDQLAVLSMQKMMKGLGFPGIMAQSGFTTGLTPTNAVMPSSLGRPKFKQPEFEMNTLIEQLMADLTLGGTQWITQTKASAKEMLRSAYLITNFNDQIEAINHAEIKTREQNIAAYTRSISDLRAQEGKKEEIKALEKKIRSEQTLLNRAEKDASYLAIGRSERDFSSQANIDQLIRDRNKELSRAKSYRETAGDGHSALAQQADAAAEQIALKIQEALATGARRMDVQELLAKSRFDPRDIKYANQITAAAGAPSATADLKSKVSKEIMDQIDQARVPGEVKDALIKMLEEVGGDVGQIVAGFDTEFSDTLGKMGAPRIQEAAITIANKFGAYDMQFAHAPSSLFRDKNFSKDAWGYTPIIPDIKTLQNRTIQRGLKIEDLGSLDQNDNLEDYRKKIQQIIDTLELIDKIGIKTVGSNISTDFREILQAVKLLEGAGKSMSMSPSFKNIIDTYLVANRLSRQKTGLEPGLAEILKSKPGEVGPLTAGSLFQKTITQLPNLKGVFTDWLKGSIEAGKPQVILAQGQKPADAHFAEVDNRMVITFFQALLKYAQSSRMIASGPAAWAGGKSSVYGKAGEDWPMSKTNRMEIPSSVFGAAVDEQRKRERERELQRQREADQEMQAATQRGTQVAKQATQAIQAETESVQKNTEAKQENVSTEEERTKRIDNVIRAHKDSGTQLDYNAAQAKKKSAEADAINEQLRGANRAKLGRDEWLELSKKRQALVDEVKVHQDIVDKMRRKVELELASNKASETAGKNYRNLQNDLSRGGGSVTVSSPQGKIPGVNPAMGGRTTISNIFGPDPVEVKNASDQIKRSLLNEVEAIKNVEKATKANLNTWISGRYALYDVANSYQNVSRQLWMFTRQVFNLTSAYRSYETAFTSVERALSLDFKNPTSGAIGLRDAFIDLSQEIPVAFEELSRIATLGAQMGISAQGIVEFTKTVAEFASVTGISADTVAQKFGKIAELTNIDSSDFYKLGSAVSYAGVNAVATESEILTLAESIAAASSSIGVTAPQVVGLSTALSSLGIPAEQARGVFTRVFADINRAVGLGGKELENFAQMAGMSASDFSRAWGEQGQSYSAFRALLGGIGGRGNMTKAFDALNIVETREINTLMRLSQNLNVLDSAMSDATGSFEDGTFLSDSFAKTVDNLDSLITIFNSNLKSLSETFSTLYAQILKPVIDGMSKFTEAVQNMRGGLTASFGAPVMTAIGVVGAAFTGLTAIMAKVVAQIYAFRVAMINSGDPTNMSGMFNQLKMLTNMSSGLVEVRTQLESVSPDARGIVQPIAYKATDNTWAKRKASLLEEHNIYLATGADIQAQLKARNDLTEAEIGLRDNASKAARFEADSVGVILKAHAAEITALQVKATSISSTSTAAEIAAAKDAEAKLKQLAGGEVLMRMERGRVVALDATTQAMYRQIAAGELLSAEMTREQAAATLATYNMRLKANTETMSVASKGVMGLGSRLIGFAGTAGFAVAAVTSLIGAIEFMGAAIKEANTVDILQSGGGLASLTAAIEKDTQAWRANRKEFEASSGFIATANVKYKDYSKQVDESTTALKNYIGVSDSVNGSISLVTESIKTQTVALGDNFNEWIMNSIMNNEKVQEWVKNDPMAFQGMVDELEGVGMSFQTILQDMIRAAQGADINPFKNLDQQIKDSQYELNHWRDVLNRQTESGLVADETITDRMTELQTQINNMNHARQVLDGIFAAVKGAFGQSALWTQIKDALGVTENGLTGLIDKYREAIQTGKGMKLVMSEIRTELMNQIPEDLLTTDIKFKINSAETVEELETVILAMIETERAANIAANGVNNFKKSAAQVALEGALNSLIALTVGGSIDDSIKNLETLAEKIKRLVDAALAGTNSLLSMNSALRAIGAGMKEYGKFDYTAKGEANIANIASAIGAVTARSKSMKDARMDLMAFREALVKTGASGVALSLVDKAIKSLGGSVKITGKDMKEYAKNVADFIKIINQGTEDAAEKTEEKIRTLSQYVEDLRKVVDSAFNYRFGRQIALDAITQSWIDMKQAAEDAAKAFKDANDELKGLNADKSILQYQLSVAERYGDEKRAASLRARLADMDKQIADKQKQISDAEDAMNKTLIGDSKAAIANRAKVRDLVQQYSAYLMALANTGMNATQLKGEAGKLADEFLAQGESLGYSRKELQEYTKAFTYDFTAALDNVPKDITVTIDTDPAKRALRDLAVEAGKTLAEINGLVFNVLNGFDSASFKAASVITKTTEVANGAASAGGSSASEYGTAIADRIEQKLANALPTEHPQVAVDKEMGTVSLVNPLTGLTRGIAASDKQSMENAIKEAIAAGFTDTATYDLNKDTVWYTPVSDIESLIPDKLKMASGGFVSGAGTGTSDSIFARLSNGEYVMSASAVSHYGVGFMNSLNQQRPSYNPSAGAFGVGGGSVVYLSPEDRALLRSAVNRPVELYSESGRLASSVNSGNTIIAKRGTN